MCSATNSSKEVGKLIYARPSIDFIDMDRSTPESSPNKSEILSNTPKKHTAPTKLLTNKLNVDEVLQDVVNPCGLWQWMITILLTVSSTSIGTFPVFANSASPHRCRMEEEVEDFFIEHNLTFSQIASFIGPWKSLEGNKSAVVTNDPGCYRYRLNWSITKLKQYFQLGNPPISTTIEVEKCPFGYIHEDNDYYYPNSVVAEFGTVCDKKWLVPTGTTLFLFGLVIGMLTSGWLGDRIGRKKTIILFSIIELLSGLWTSVSNSYTSFVLGRTFMGIGNMGKLNACNILILEITTAKYRSTFSAVFASGTNFFFRALLSLWAYCIPNWRYLNLVTLSPHIFTVLYFHLVPESPRWLNSQGQVKKALRVLEFGYKINHLQSEKKPSDIFEDYYSNQVPVDQKCQLTSRGKLVVRFRQCILGPFATRELAKISFSCLIMIAGITTTFFGLLYYARIVRSYVYLVAFLNSTTAIPGILLFLFLYRFLRYRKRPFIILLATSATVLLAVVIYNLTTESNTDIFLTVFSNIALTLVSTCLSMCYVYLPELFPSDIRTQSFGLVMGVGRICSLSCTFINEVDRHSFHGSPLLIYACLLYAGLAALLVVKDTSGENLPDQQKLEDTEMTSQLQLEEKSTSV
ncbi:unnamed protein product [Calicophoron daubneyi]|uniref:Major facilitator superfamily (MFS) profile domain-containing protein n=1 Tax=Calicophoron daubneyi TaxID=300641 RepID=A0AAV2T906_CALDB